MSEKQDKVKQVETEAACACLFFESDIGAGGRCLCGDLSAYHESGTGACRVGHDGVTFAKKMHPFRRLYGEDAALAGLQEASDAALERIAPAVSTSVQFKKTPFEKKRDRLWTAIGSVREQLDDLVSRRAFAVADAEKAKSAAELAVSHAKEDIAAVADHTLNLLARRDQLRAELEQVAALIVNAAQLGEEKATAAVTAGRQLTASESALIEAGKPFDRHIEALRDDSEKLKYRFDQHIARGPGSTALFVGVRR